MSDLTIPDRFTSVMLRLEDGTIALVPVSDVTNNRRWKWWNAAIPLPNTPHLDRYLDTVNKVAWNKYVSIAGLDIKLSRKPVKKSWRQIKTRNLLTRFGVI